MSVCHVMSGFNFFGHNSSLGLNRDLGFLCGPPPGKPMMISSSSRSSNSAIRKGAYGASSPPELR